MLERNTETALSIIGDNLVQKEKTDVIYYHNDNDNDWHHSIYIKMAANI